MADSFEPRFVDLVRNYTTTVGTGNFVLGSAVNGYQSFASAVQPGDSFYYSAIGIDKPDQFEVGRGRMEPDGTISRDPIGGAFTSFTAGNKSVALVAAAEWYESIQAGATASLAAAASREELAALADLSKPALLTEQGREGIFVFDRSDLSDQVSGDQAQGIHVAPASNPTGAGGAWVRRFDSSVEARWFGASGDGAADDTAALQAAIRFVEGRGGGVLRLGSGTFLTAGSLLLAGDDVTIDAYGATVTSSDQWSIPMLWLGGNRARIMGGIWRATSGAARQFDINGQECHLEGCVIEHAPDADTVQMYVRYGANGFSITNCRFSGANEAMFLEASNVVIQGNEFLASETIGGDDCIAIKAIQGITENIRIVGNHMRRHAAMVSFGSNIGMVGEDDPTYSRRVRNVTIVGNTGERCAYGLYIKPGAVQVDYRNGVVEGVTFSNNILHDPGGDRFERGIAITAGRGAIVRDIHGDNNIVIARASGTGATGAKVGLHIAGQNSADSKTFRNIDVELIFRDPYGGVPAGGEAPGYPVANIVSVQPNGAEISNLNLRVEGSGCAGAGISIQSGVDDGVTIGRAILDTINVAATADGGISTRSRIRVGDDVSISMANGNPYRLVNGTTAEIVSNTDMVFFAEAIGAGADQSRRPWAAPRNAFVTRVELLSASAIPQSPDDTSFTRFELRNIGGTSNIFAWASSQQTGGKAFPSDVYNTVMAARDMAESSLPDCHFRPGSMLQFNKNDFGSGNVVNRAYLRIHWAPY